MDFNAPQFGKVPIRKGCKAKKCFCDGSCKEIIGWRDKLPNETILDSDFLEWIKELNKQRFEILPSNAEKEEESGFFDIDPKKYCDHPNHLPPNYIHIPAGKGYRHICPKCKKKTIVYSPNIFM